eukprot:CAMPEP_0171738980 /NCGR_PEP_ID=MMETSP0991-20121206/33943_1 /TAXON_ID=483369 /ORGANISM="non described non described, Strain CCMP2098" /LENGTH=154 /DNA_ID=CAMNT_0012336475 /DNA_START=356 /DNA_END=817 /DNA_ORIENTATION=+
MARLEVKNTVIPRPCSSEKRQMPHAPFTSSAVCKIVPTTASGAPLKIAANAHTVESKYMTPPAAPYGPMVLQFIATARDNAANSSAPVPLFRYIKRAVEIPSRARAARANAKTPTPSEATNVNIGFKSGVDVVARVERRSQVASSTDSNEDGNG